jgi:ABC transporter substrate binding protein
VQGRNLRIDYRSAENAPEFLPRLAAELVEAQVYVIVVSGGPAAAAASVATSRIPIVFTVHPDPVGSGLVRSLGRPGGNVTGVSFLLPELAAKRVESLREVLPHAKRVTALWGADNSAPTAEEAKATAQIASKVGMVVGSHAVDRGETLLRILEQLARTRPDALLIFDVRMAAYRDIIIERANELRLPTIAGWADFVRAGGLFCYAPNFPARRPPEPTPPTLGYHGHMHRRLAVVARRLRLGACVLPLLSCSGSTLRPRRLRSRQAFVVLAGRSRIASSGPMHPVCRDRVSRRYPAGSRMGRCDP